MCKVFGLLALANQGREARPERDPRAALSCECPPEEAAVFYFFIFHYILFINALIYFVLNQVGFHVFSGLVHIFLSEKKIKNAP